MKTLVIGGTGTVGREVLAQLPVGGGVRAMVRNAARAGLPGHVEMVRGDLTVPESLDAALRGVETVFLVWTAPPDAVVPAMERILRQVRRIVFLSAPHRTDHPFFQAAQPNRMATMQAGIEGLIGKSGREWTFLRPGIFSANSIGWWGPQIRTGDVVRWPYPEVATAPIDERDIAAVAVRALCEDGHAGAEYVITGPEALTQREQVAAIGRALGRKLRMEEISEEAARSELLRVIPSPPVVGYLMKAWVAVEGHPAFVTSTVEKLTGVPARTFENWARDHAAAFRD